MIQAQAAVNAMRVVVVFGFVYRAESAQGERELALRVFVGLRRRRPSGSGSCVCDGIASNPSHESAWTENSLRIENAF